MDYNQIANEWSNKRKSSRHYAHDLLEKPAMLEILGRFNLADKSVLCLGCGSGEECEYFLDKKAKVLGVDNSFGLIENAKYSYPQASFLCSDIETMDLGDLKFDFIYSSLTLHYLKDWPKLFLKLQKHLIKPGYFLFSCHHPIKWSAEEIRKAEFNSFNLGYTKYKKTDEYKIYGNYLDFYEKESLLFGKLKIKYYHRSFSKIFSDINKTNFIITDLI